MRRGKLGAKYLQQYAKEITQLLSSHYEHQNEDQLMNPFLLRDVPFKAKKILKAEKLGREIQSPYE